MRVKVAPRIYTVSIFSTLILGGCGGNEPDPGYPVAQLKTRAGADFECPREQVKTKTLGDRTKVAEGCGQTGTYIYICNKCEDTGSSFFLGRTVVDDCECTWMLDSARRRRSRK